MKKIFSLLFILIFAVLTTGCCAINSPYKNFEGRWVNVAADGNNANLKLNRDQSCVFLADDRFSQYSNYEITENSVVFYTPDKAHKSVFSIITVEDVVFLKNNNDFYVHENMRSMDEAEITIDNWQDYFELVPRWEADYYNGDTYKTQPYNVHTNLYLVLKEDIAGRLANVDSAMPGYYYGTSVGPEHGIRIAYCSNVDEGYIYYDRENRNFVLDEVTYTYENSAPDLRTVNQYDLWNSYITKGTAEFPVEERPATYLGSYSWKVRTPVETTMSSVDGRLLMFDRPLHKYIMDLKATDLQE